MATKLYSVTYLVELEDNVEFPETVSAFWVKKVLQNPDLNLPEFVHSVMTVPRVEELTKPKKSASVTTQSKTKTEEK